VCNVSGSLNLKFMPRRLLTQMRRTGSPGRGPSQPTSEAVGRAASVTFDLKSASAALALAVTVTVLGPKSESSEDYRELSPGSQRY